MKNIFAFFSISSLIFTACSIPTPLPTDILHVNIAGEPTQNSIILQSRLIREDTVVTSLFEDVAGVPGYGYFQVSSDSLFEQSMKTNLLQATAANDFTLKAKVNNLSPATPYFYRVWVGSDSTDLRYGKTCRFNTLLPPADNSEVSFIHSSCMNYEKYYNIGDSGVGERIPDLVSEEDWQKGFIGFETLASLDPLFWVANGDNVYYDHPYSIPAETREELLAKWHRQFSMPRIRELMCQVPSYWLKDDHDYRFNDADTTDEKFAEPSHELGITTFKEVIPITDPDNEDEPTYRTHRVNQLLQIWMMEGRDYRSPHNLPDTAGKTLWGDEQVRWLQETLLASDAPFKIIISPTPLIGPDDAYKKDNHTNPGGFQFEQQQIFKWLVENDFQSQDLYFMCGDRHWQYHSRNELGFEEFGSGALVDQNARSGRMPGDPKSTDPEGKIEQIFVQKEPTGGFVQVTVKPNPSPNITFEIKDERGELLHAVQYKAETKIL